MVKKLLVDNRIDEGQTFLTELTREGMEILVAAWAKRTESQMWKLYIVPVGYDRSIQSQRDARHAKMMAGLSRLKSGTVTILDIQFVEPTDVIAQDLLKVQPPQQGVRLTRFIENRLGNWDIDELYVYPPLKKDENLLREQTVEIVTDLSVENGNLKVSKQMFSLPRQPALALPQEWVTDVKLVGDQLLVTKVKLTQGVEGVRTEYREERLQESPTRDVAPV